MCDGIICFQYHVNINILDFCKMPCWPLTSHTSLPVYLCVCKPCNVCSRLKLKCKLLYNLISKMWQCISLPSHQTTCVQRHQYPSCGDVPLTPISLCSEAPIPLLWWRAHHTKQLVFRGTNTPLVVTCPSHQTACVQRHQYPSWCLHRHGGVSG